MISPLWLTLQKTTASSVASSVVRERGKLCCCSLFPACHNDGSVITARDVKVVNLGNGFLFEEGCAQGGCSRQVGGGNFDIGVECYSTF